MQTLAVADPIERAAELAADFAERAAEHDRSASFPFENFERLYAAGLLGLPVPVQYGGAGAGLATCCKVVERVAMGDASTALVLALHYLTHGLAVVERRWPPAIHERLGRDAVERGGLINAVRVEPELGTPTRGGLPVTTAERTADGWRISGHKLYVTGSPILRWLAVLARTADAEPLVGTFLVPADAAGVRIVETWDHLGMRATASHDVLLEAVEIPFEQAVDLRPPLAVGPPSRLTSGWNALLLSALYHGVALAARDWLVDYLHRRVPSNLGASLATLPRFQAAIGEIEALLHASDRLIHGTAAELDDDPAAVPPSAPGLVKLTATSNAIRSVEIGLALIGNPGLARKNPLERYYRDVLCSRIHSPQDDAILAAAGRGALGITPPGAAARKES